MLDYEINAIHRVTHKKEARTDVMKECNKKITPPIMEEYIATVCFKMSIEYLSASKCLIALIPSLEKVLTKSASKKVWE